MKIRDQIITFNVHRLALPVVKHFVPPATVPFTMDQLRALPEGTMGNDLFHFLSRNNFSLLPYFETHDVKHVLLNYGVSGQEEACMQYFYLGNRHYSVASLVSATVSLLLMPEHIGSFIKAFRRGRKTRPIGRLNLGALLHLNTKDVRAQLQIPPRPMLGKARPLAPLIRLSLENLNPIS
jgi:ubiquinone biosynthesis protein Coq4